MTDNQLQENPVKALKVVIGVALLCALVVSFTAVYLRPYYVANLEAERMARLSSILEALDKVAADITPEDIEARLVELESGRYEDAFDVSTYDSRQALTDPAKSSEIPPQHDLAGIKRRADFEIVYLLRNVNGQINLVILPVRGVGYQSALYGYLALSADANEILALKFYAHGETPGLGSKIQDPYWEAQWPGKLAFNEQGQVSIRVGVTGSGGDRVDGISGATMTTRGVDSLVRFWLGDFGFGPYLKRVRNAENQT